MRYVTIVWDDGVGGNVEHITQHRLTPDEVEDVLQDHGNQLDRSRSTGMPIVFGRTRTGRHILVAFEEIDETSIYPITAYDVPELR